MDVPLWLIRKDLGISLEKGLPYVLGRNVTLRQVLIFCGYYRKLGIAEFFLSGQPEEFFGNLSKSAWAFAFYLEGAQDVAKATGRVEPFFDAIACGDHRAAQAIVNGARATWNEEEEYEEDFLYARLMMDRFVLGADRDHVDGLLRRYAQVLDGVEDARFNLCRALVEGDQRLFDENLERMLGDRRRETEKRLKAGRMSPNDAATVSQLWVELLALLRFATEAGLKLERNYPLAPSVSRRIRPAGLPAMDAWRDLPSFFELE